MHLACTVRLADLCTHSVAHHRTDANSHRASHRPSNCDSHYTSNRADCATDRGAFEETQCSPRALRQSDRYAHSDAKSCALAEPIAGTYNSSLAESVPSTNNDTDPSPDASPHVGAFKDTNTCPQCHTDRTNSRTDVQTDTGADSAPDFGTKHRYFYMLSLALFVCESALHLFHLFT